jgi:hypothetical protein
LNRQIRLEHAALFAEQGFGTAQVNQGFDYVVLENARQLNPNEYKCPFLSNQMTE